MTWPQVPLKHLARINPEALGEDTDPDFELRYLDIGSVGRGRLLAAPDTLTFGAAPSRARRIVRAGDVIISTVRTYLRAVLAIGPPEDGLIVSTGFAVLRPTTLHAGFARWLMESDGVVEEIVARSVGVSYPAISPGEIGEIRAPVPSEREQAWVADFLDRETARIDGLITAKRRMIELLEERMASVREAWARELERTWGHIPLRRLLDRIEQGSSPECAATSAEPDEWGVLKTSSVTGPVFRPTENKLLLDAAAFDSRWIVNDGDLLVTRGSGSRSHVGRAAVANAQGRRLLLPDLIYRLVAPNADPHFIADVLGAQGSRDRLQAAIRTDAGQTLKLRGDDLRDLPVPAADRGIQAQEHDRLQAALRPMTRLSGVLGIDIDLLHERRRTLITGAVTGALAIPGVAVA